MTVPTHQPYRDKRSWNERRELELSASDPILAERPTSVSVILTTFQSEDFVVGALESVYNQSVAPHEVIVCDDGSTDGTLDLVSRFDARIIRLPHSGIVAVSRNEGIGQSSGDWIAFLDADDRWHPHHLAYFLEVLGSFEQSSFDLFSGNGLRFKLGGTSLPFFRDEDQLQSGMCSLQDFLRIRPVITSSAIARRATLKELGGFQSMVLQVAVEDFQLWYRMLRHGGLYFDERVHVHYFVNPEGISLRGGGYPAREALVRVMKEHVDEERDPQAKKHLKEALAADSLTLARAHARDRQFGPALMYIAGAARAGFRPFANVVARALEKRGRRLLRAALLLTVGASVLVSLLGLSRQKVLSSVLHATGLADLSLMLSIAMPLVTLASWPLLGFAKDLNSTRNEDYGSKWRLSALICLVGYFLGALLATLLAYSTNVFQFPLGNKTGFLATLLFGLGILGVGQASAVYVFRGDLKKWRRLTLFTAGAQLLAVTVCTLVAGRTGAVFSMALTTAVIGGFLLARPFLRGRGSLYRIPRGLLTVSAASGLVSLTLVGVEAALRQGSVGISITTGAYYQASLSVIGAISAGVAQYSAGRLLPIATAASDPESVRRLWSEVRRSLALVALFMGVVGSSLALIAPQLLAVLFSSPFASASLLLRSVILGESLVAIATVVSATMLGLRRLRLWALISILPGITRLLVFFLLAGSVAQIRLGCAYGAGGLVAIVMAFGVYLSFSWEVR